jgi:3-hydroxy-3-methylglutaryl CoA synthase/uncharacterized OB-fold protein
MRGIIGYGAYVPYRRLDRSVIAPVLGTGGGKGTRTVASYDEDTTTMGVEAARVALRSADGVEPTTLWFSTVDPAYLDKSNATALHAALRLGPATIAADFGGAVRSGVAALRAALTAGEPTLVVTADIRTGLPGSADEVNGGDGAAAFIVGNDDDGRVIAEFLAASSATSEFVDRWRTPGDNRSKAWEERFGETQYVPLGEQAWTQALQQAGLTGEQIDRVIVTGNHARAAASLTRKLGVAAERLADDLAATVGNTGTAHPGLLLASVLDDAAPGQVVAVVTLADGADVLLLRTTQAIAGFSNPRPITEQIARGKPIAYGKFLSWRGMLTIEPPRRPEPQRVSSSAAVRATDWKFGFVASRDPESGAVHLPPTPVDRERLPKADDRGTIVTYTIDRIAYSPSPPIVFAIVDFDGGGRLPVELTDIDPGDVAIGGRVEMTFRRLFTADGIHNYFWKARPAPA